MSSKFNIYCSAGLTSKLLDRYATANAELSEISRTEKERLCDIYL